MDKSLEYAQELQRIIKHKTVSKYYETDFSRFFDLHQELKNLFPLVFEKCEIKLFDASILIKWKGKNSKNPVMFMNHHDVVEAEGNWKYPAFDGKIVDGKIYGRGVLDTKGGLYCMLKASELLLQDNFIPNNDIYFVSTCTEEVDGLGAKKISNYLFENKIRFSAIYDEGGMIVDDPLGISAGKYAMIGIGEKGCHSVKFTAKSFGGHASAPPKNSPLVRLSKFIVEVENTKKFKAKFTKNLREMFKRFSINMKGVKKFIFSHSQPISPLLKIVMPKISATANAMLKTTVAFTMATGSATYNAIPQCATIVADVRFSHHQGSEKSLRVLEEIAKKYDIEMQIIDEGIESGITDFNGQSFKTLEKTINEVFPKTVVVPFISNTAADIRFMSKICDNCLRFTPFTISDEQLNGIHGIDENLNIDCLNKAVDFYKKLMERA